MSMSVEETPNRTPQILLAVGAVLVLVIAIVVGRNFLPNNREIVVKMSPEKQAKMDWIDQKAKEVQGDWRRLSPADQAKLNQETNGYGALSISKSWQASQRGKK